MTKKSLFLIIGVFNVIVFVSCFLFAFLVASFSPATLVQGNRLFNALIITLMVLIILNISLYLADKLAYRFWGNVQSRLFITIGIIVFVLEIAILVAIEVFFNAHDIRLVIGNFNFPFSLIVVVLLDYVLLRIAHRPKKKLPDQTAE